MKNIFLSNKLGNKLFPEILPQILSSKIFWLGILIKLILSFTLASQVLTDLFLPFVNFYVSSNFSDPYQNFALSKFDSFPYPSLMLWMVSIPYWLFLFLAKLAPSLSYFISIGSLRIPILICDFVILLIFARWFKFNLSKLLIFYWLSPVLIYINYIHGQLDVIPIAILLLSLFFLFRKNFAIASILLGLALSAKTNILIAVPFFLIYLFSQRLSWYKLPCYMLIVFGVFAIINLPYLASDGFLYMVFFNNTQTQVFDLLYRYSPENIFYFIPAIYLILLLKAMMIKTYNRDLFIMFLGFSFGVLNLFIPPMQGWYYWILPFFIYFYIKKDEAPNFLFFILQGAYLLYFGLIKNSDYLQVFQFVAPDIYALPNLHGILIQNGFDANKLTNLSFTLLQVCLMLNCFWIYRRGICDLLKHKLIYKPYLVGISGDSGVGKTALVSSIIDVFGEKSVSALCGDDMHKWERGHKRWNEYTHLNPRANKLHEEIRFLKALKNGRNILRRTYDHDNGKFCDPKVIESKKLIILEGLHSFYIEGVRNLFDIKIFVKPHDTLRLHWKIIRDQALRGYTKDQILQQLLYRKEDSEKFITSQEKYADIKIEILPEVPIKDIGNENEKTALSVKISFCNNVDIDQLLECLDNVSSINVIHEFDENSHQFIVVSDNISQEKIMRCGSVLFEEDFEEINLAKPKWESGIVGFIQLFITFYIIKSERGDF